MVLSHHLQPDQSSVSSCLAQEGRGSGLWRLLQGPWLSVHVFAEVRSLSVLGVWISLISLTREGIDQSLRNLCPLGYAPCGQFTEP